MANCPIDNGKLMGRNIVVEVADGCPDVRPEEAEWKALAACTSKTLDLAPNTTNSEADDTKGWVENLLTTADATISIEGEVGKNDKLDQYGIGRFTKYFADEMSAMRQPTLWVRIQAGPIEFSAYMLITALTPFDGGTNDIVTFSTEFKVANADTVKVDIVNDVPLTGVSVAPETLSLTVGTNGTFTVNFTPTGATNKNFTVQSDDVAIATVSAVGPVVTVVPVAAGTANAIVITDDGQKVAVVDITVAAE